MGAWAGAGSRLRCGSQGGVGSLPVLPAARPRQELWRPLVARRGAAPPARAKRRGAEGGGWREVLWSLPGRVPGPSPPLLPLHGRSGPTRSARQKIPERKTEMEKVEGVEEGGVQAGDYSSLWLGRGQADSLILIHL